MRRELARYIPFFILILWIIYLIPVISHVYSSDVDVSIIFENNPELTTSYFRSHIIAIFSALLSCLFALIISYTLINREFNWAIGLVLAILLIPTLLGDTSVSLTWRINVLGFDWLYGKPIRSFIGLIFINVWQIGTFLSYVLYISFYSSKLKERNFINSINLDSKEKLRKIYIPHNTVTVVLLFIYAYSVSLYADFKMRFVFNSTRGLDTELLGQVLERVYMSYSLNTPIKAFSFLGEFTLYTFFLEIIFMAILSYIIYNLLKWYSEIPSKYQTNKYRFSSYFLFIILAATILLPILYSFYTYYQFSMNIYVSMLSSLGYTVLAATIIYLIVFIITTFARIKFDFIFRNLNLLSALTILSLLCIYFIPPISIINISFKWMSEIGYNNKLIVVLAWIFSHLICSMPIIAAFNIVLYFAVDQKKIEYFKSMNASFREHMKFIFLPNSIMIYVLLYIVTIIIVWNNSTINFVMADYIPSFVTELKKVSFGVSADYNTGMAYVSISLLLSVVSTLILNSIIYKTLKS